MAAHVRVNRWLDLLERVAWTAIQAAAASTIVVLSTGMTWQQGFATVGIAAGLAVCKVLLAQNLGDDELGALTPPGQHVLEEEGSAPAVGRRPVEG